LLDSLKKALAVCALIAKMNRGGDPGQEQPPKPDTA
jgi:hypothetical protein